jgi:LysR family glycine cleavage system transcriptional activator
MLLHDDTGDMYDGESFWEVWLEAAGITDIDAKRGARFSHAVLAFEAAIDAVGVVASMPSLAAEELASGKLVMPFDLKVPLASAYYLVCEPHAKTRPAVAAFRDWLIAEAAKDSGVSTS